MERVRDGFMNNGKVEAKLRYALVTVLKHAEKRFDGLPRTHTNLRAAREGAKLLEQLGTELVQRNAKAMTQAIPSSLQSALNRAFRMGTANNATRLATARDLNEVLGLLDVAMRELGGSDSVASRLAMTHGFREIGAALESIFYGEQDLASPAVRYKTASGTTLVMPPGWLLWSQELANEIKQQLGIDVRWEPGTEAAFLRTGTFGDGRIRIGLAATVTQPSQGLQLTDVNLAMARSELFKSLSIDLSGLREFSVSRSADKSSTRMVVRGTFGRPEQPNRLLNTMFIGADRCVWVHCYAHYADVRDECKQVPDSVQF